MKNKKADVQQDFNKDKSNNNFSFTQRNYMFMAIGAVCIALGFFLMTGLDANTRPDGTYDPDYWNEGIFSWVRIRLAPFLVLLGFVLEAYGILLKPKS